jgi:hypothetical protein
MHGWVIHCDVVNDGSQPAEFADALTFILPPEIGIRSQGRVHPAGEGKAGTRRFPRSGGGRRLGWAARRS